MRAVESRFGVEFRRARKLVGSFYASFQSTLLTSLPFSRLLPHSRSNPPHHRPSRPIRSQSLYLQRPPSPHSPAQRQLLRNRHFPRIHDPDALRWHRRREGLAFQPAGNGGVYWRWTGGTGVYVVSGEVLVARECVCFFLFFFPSSILFVTTFLPRLACTDLVSVSLDSPSTTARRRCNACAGVFCSLCTTTSPEAGGRYCASCLSLCSLALVK
jgi:hypothetical protein